MKCGRGHNFAHVRKLLRKIPGYAPAFPHAPGEMMSAPKISLLLLSVLLPAVSCSRFKISIPDESSAETARDSLAKRADGACSDFERVSSPETLSFPDGFQDLQRPWIDNYRAYAGTSETVTNGINHLFTLKVPGLEGQTIMEVIGILKRNGCLSFPFGGAVRDQFLGSPPKDLDMESNCDADTLYRICKENWDHRSSNCRRSASVTNPIVHIGNSSAKDEETEPLDAANWDKTFFGNGTALEYTTNSIAFIGEGLNITIDLTGSGVSDTCNKLIRIPTNDRDHWVSRTKVYRYWKLRVKGYTPVDADTMTFITDMAKDFIDEQPDPSLKFYCETVLHGKWASPMCQIDSMTCEAAIKNKIRYDEYLEMDLGAFWIDTAKEMVDNLSISQCGCVRPEVVPGKQKRQYSAGDACNGSQGLTLSPSSFLLLVLSLILGAEIVV